MKPISVLNNVVLKKKSFATFQIFLQGVTDDIFFQILGVTSRAGEAADGQEKGRIN